MASVLLRLLETKEMLPRAHSSAEFINIKPVLCVQESVSSCWFVFSFVCFHIWVRSYGICLSELVHLALIPASSTHVAANGKISGWGEGKGERAEGN